MKYVSQSLMHEVSFQNRYVVTQPEIHDLWSICNDLRICVNFEMYEQSMYEQSQGILGRPAIPNPVPSIHFHVFKFGQFFLKSGKFLLDLVFLKGDS